MPPSHDDALLGEEATLIQNPDSTRRAPSPELRLAWLERGAPRFATVSDRTLIGSAPRAGIVVVDPTVSRLHAEIELRPDGAWIRDLGSSNGTFVEGVLVGSARLPEGGRVRLGSTEFSVRYARDGEGFEVWNQERFGPLLGASTASRRLFAQLARVAETDSPVLIQGETGTGKELVASAIHQASSRADKPFVIIDCAALPESLIESELFGHARGAFTGASQAREGAFESADGGTIFLDEIGELPLSLQPRLLRVLESSSIRRLGETTRRPIDVRILSATHRDLRTMVNAGAFREDLYFRLAVLPVNVPPLRERVEDIPLLVKHFAPREGRLTEEELFELSRRPWLGNVRELRNFVHRAAALGTRAAMNLELDVGRPSAPPPAAPPPASPLPPSGFQVSGVPVDCDFKTFREQWIDRGEREYVRHLLERHGRSVSAAARAAGVDRTYVYRLIRKHAL